MRLPVSITPSPIVETVFDTRFRTEMPEEAIFGLVYQSVREDFPKMSPLPLAGLPPAMRRADPEFAYQPLHRLEGDRLVLLIGPQAIAIAQNGAYQGWSEFSRGVMEVYRKIEKTGLFQSVERFGLRYINFFEGDMLGKLTLSIYLGEIDLKGEESFFRTILEWNGCSCHLQVGKGLQLSNRQGVVGSVVDIDAFENFPTSPGGQVDPEGFLERSHFASKDLFFSLLRPEYLATMSPTYAPKDIKSV